MTTVEGLQLLIPALFFSMFAIELLRPGYTFPKVARWHLIGLLTFVYSVVMNIIIPLTLPESWLREHRVFDLSQLGILPSVIIAHVVLSFFTFSWHWLCHKSDFLWRMFHQIHHAPRRMNVYVANWFHPLDMMMYGMLYVLVTLFLLGLNPVAASIVGVYLVFGGFFQHWTIRTPHWVGYIIQRPESHYLHHQRHSHQYNYSDFPLWDIIFGTFRNPKEIKPDLGFDPPADTRYGAMLAFVDVNATPPAHAIDTAKRAAAE